MVQPTRASVAITAYNLDLLIAIAMLGLTTILSLRLFHTSAKRQVAIKQRTVAAFANRRQCELQVFHGSVIIAKPKLLVNSDSGLALQPKVFTHQIGRIIFVIPYVIASGSQSRFCSYTIKTLTQHFIFRLDVRVCFKNLFCYCFHTQIITNGELLVNQKKSP